jgi:hypothetical protein
VVGQISLERLPLMAGQTDLAITENLLTRLCRLVEIKN